jgi:hypothetical protein
MIVMHALDSDKANSNDLAGLVRRKIAADTATGMQMNDLDPSEETAKDEYMWLYDTMKTLIVKILENDPSLRSGMSEQLLKDVNALMEEYGINREQAALQSA